MRATGLVALAVFRESVRDRVPLTIVGFGVLLGFYDGFFGPGAGSLYLLGFVMLAGCGLLQATANTKILNLTSNLVSLIVFVLSGKVVFAVGLLMALGQTAGAWFGARAAMVA